MGALPRLSRVAPQCLIAWSETGSTSTMRVKRRFVFPQCGRDELGAGSLNQERVRERFDFRLQ